MQFMRNTVSVTKRFYVHTVVLEWAAQHLVDAEDVLFFLGSLDEAFVLFTTHLSPHTLSVIPFPSCMPRLFRWFSLDTVPAGQDLSRPTKTLFSVSS